MKKMKLDMKKLPMGKKRYNVACVYLARASIYISMMHAVVMRQREKSREDWASLL